MSGEAAHSNSEDVEQSFEDDNAKNTSSKYSDDEVPENENLYNPEPPEFFRDRESCPDPQDKLALSMEEKRREYLLFTREEKLLKLASYSSCLIQSCRCKGWKPPESILKPRDYKSDKCNFCHHTLLDHYSQIQNHPEDFLNYLLNYAVDLEAIYDMYCVEQDIVSKEIYRLLCGALQKSISDFVKPDMSKFMDLPPFEEKNISQALRDIIIFKYSKCSEPALQNVIICAKIILQYIETLCLMKVIKWKEYFPDENAVDYIISYGRWMTYCFMPQVHKSFEHFNMLDIFGPKHLKVIYPYFQQIATYVISNEARSKEVKDCCRRLINVIGEELANNSSVVWRKFQPSKVHSLIPDRLKPCSYRSACPRFTLCIDSDEDVFSPDFSVVPLPSCEKLLNGVPEDIVRAAIMNALKKKSPNPIEGSMESKDRFAKIEVHVIANSVKYNVSPECLLYLAALKDILARLLPEIPKMLITRYLFDTHHRCIALVREGKVLGGVCFRMFPEQNFSEIVFLGFVEKGLGGYLMNHLKDYHLQRKIYYFLSYVNSETVPFFKAQGFTAEITLDRRIYTKYLKEYTRAVLMECRLMPGIRYTALAKVTKIQLNIVKEMAKRRFGKLNEKLPSLLKESEEAQETDHEKSSDLNCPVEPGPSKSSEDPVAVPGPSKPHEDPVAVPGPSKPCEDYSNFSGQ